MKIHTPDTHLLTENISYAVSDLKEKTNKDIWLAGGGQLVTKFINEGLVDKMIISIIPKIIGEGIPLFSDKPKETNLKLIEAKQFDTGVVILIYEKAD